MYVCFYFHVTDQTLWLAACQAGTLSVSGQYPQSGICVKNILEDSVVKPNLETTHRPRVKGLVKFNSMTHHKWMFSKLALLP